jgi:hypothetical protein
MCRAPLPISIQPVDDDSSQSLAVAQIAIPDFAIGKYWRS